MATSSETPVNSFRKQIHLKPKFRVRPHSVPKTFQRRKKVLPLSQEQDSNKDIETPISKFRRVAGAVRLIARVCYVLRRYAKLSESGQDKSLIEIQVKLEEEIKKNLSFNVAAFKGHNINLNFKKYSAVLSIPPSDRANTFLQKALSILKCNKAFQDFPKNIQKKLCKCMFYQSYEKGRVVLRKGHYADSFYIILSGILLNNTQDVDHYNGNMDTISELDSGNIFGERALLTEGRRDSTVTCKTDVELLAVMKEDFDEIIKESLQKRLDHHILFLQNLDLFVHFPCEKLIEAREKSLFFCQHYSKGKIITNSQTNLEHLIVVIKGVCKVVAKIEERKKGKLHNRRRELNATFPLELHQKTLTRKIRCKSADCIGWESGEMRDDIKANILSGCTDPGKLLTLYDPALDHRVFMDGDLERRFKIKAATIASPITCIKPDRFQISREKSKDKKFTPHVISRPWSAQIPKRRTTLEMVDQDISNKDVKVTFAQIAVLHAGDVFGVESIFQKLPKNLCLVSEGAECLLISKKFFMKECNAKVMEEIGKMAVMYPTNDFIKQQVQEKRAWESYKRNVLKEVYQL